MRFSRSLNKTFLSFYSGERLSVKAQRDPLCVPGSCASLDFSAAELLILIIIRKLSHTHTLELHAKLTRTISSFNTEETHDILSFNSIHGRKSAPLISNMNDA